MDCDSVSVRELRPEQQRAVEEALGRVRDEYRARVVLLVETCGRPLASTGLSAGQDLDALASLIASTVSAASQLCRVLGEADLTLALQRDDRDRLHLVPLGGAVLAVLLDENLPEGLERVRARLRRSRSVAKIAETLRGESATPDHAPHPLPGDTEEEEIEGALAGLAEVLVS